MFASKYQIIYYPYFRARKHRFGAFSNNRREKAGQLAGRMSLPIA